MQSIIEEIFYKKLGYRVNVPDDEEYKKRSAEYDKLFEALEETLTESQRKMLDDLYFCGGGVDGVVNYLYFKDGFRAGVLLGMELLSSKDET